MEEKNGKLSVITAPKTDGNLDRKKSFWHINKQMLPLKMHFFLFIGGMGAFLPYLSVIGISKLGLTASNLAAAFTAQQFFFLILKPGIGYLADFFNRLKATIVGLTILQAMFCFFMIIIPSADIQKNEALKSSISLNNTHYCHLCNHTEKLTNISLNQPLAGDIFEQVLNCFKYFELYENENYDVHCQKENSDYLYNINTNYRILKVACEDSFSKNFSSLTNSTTHHSFYSGDILFIIPAFNSLQNSSIVCLPPKGKVLFSSIFSYSHMKQHCHAASKSQTLDLQDVIPTMAYNTTDCQNYKPSISAIQKYEYDAALSAANFQTYQFWLYALCLVLSCTCISSIFTMSDTACYESVEGADYGKQRAWGAISWGLFAPFAGFLNDYTGGYMASWLLMTILCSLQIWNLSRMDLVKPDFSQSILKDIKAVFSSVEFIAFEAGVLMNGMFTGIIWFYLTWFLISIGGNKFVIGLAHTFECFFGEVPIMFVSGWMIEKFGHFNLVSLALFTHAIRFFIYSYLHNPWLVLPVECLHGFTFASFYSAMTSYGKLNSKPGTEATTQSVLCTTYEALGAGLGCLISGVCFDYYGTHTTFFYASFLAAASTALFMVCSLLIGCRKGNLNVTAKVSSCKERY